MYKLWLWGWPIPHSDALPELDSITGEELYWVRVRRRYIKVSRLKYFRHKQYVHDLWGLVRNMLSAKMTKYMHNQLRHTRLFLESAGRCLNESWLQWLELPSWRLLEFWEIANIPSQTPPDIPNMLLIEHFSGGEITPIGEDGRPLAKHYFTEPSEGGAESNNWLSCFRFYRWWLTIPGCRSIMGFEEICVWLEWCSQRVSVHDTIA